MRTYGSLILTEASPAQSFTEPLSLAQVRKYLRLTEASPSDSDEDELLNALISAARETAEIEQGRDLVEKQWDLALDDFTPEIILRNPLQSVDLVKYKDSDGNWTTLTENTDYIVDTARDLLTLPPDTEWPTFDAWTTSAVLIRFTSGYSASDIFWNDEGKRILQAMKMLCELWYDKRIAIANGQIAAVEIPYGITMLLRYGARNRVT